MLRHLFWALFYTLPLIAHSYTSGASMVSDEFIINNPICLITKAQGDQPILPVLEPDDEPSVGEYFEIEMTTQINYLPYLSRSSNIAISGIENPDVDEITLNQIKLNGSIEELSQSETPIEMDNPTHRSFRTKLFFRAKQTKDNYPARTITAQTTVTIECRT